MKTQMKVSVDTGLASSFKTACIASNVLMANVISEFMSGYVNAAAKKKPTQDYSTRRKRRASIKLIIKQLEQIKDGEERYMENMPENLHGSALYDAAEEYISLIDEAVSLLDSI